jgi:hypothetical protein
MAWWWNEVLAPLLCIPLAFLALNMMLYLPCIVLAAIKEIGKGFK